MDRKVILAIVGGNRLVAFDQHAVDERVRLEAHLRELRERGALHMRVLDASVSLSAASADACLRLKDRLLPWWVVCGNPQHGVRVSHSAVVCDVQLTAEDMLEYARSLSSGHSSTFSLPLAVERVAAYRACRGAIKFGDLLTRDECQSLLEKLHHCQLPFICAHGRQNVVALYLL